ncbi:hypothetical protein TFLX_00719 [Thermoflexales bacterium]|nr:hypothetical protein TFLX_00719 [Thermoflexales bacterium]
MNPIFRTINFALQSILRSPLHRLLSRSLMLITVTGHRSGRMYTVPVSYQQQGATVRIISERHDHWWRNLRGGAPVTLQLQGCRINGQGCVSEDPPDVMAQLTLHLRQSPNLARMLRVRRNERGESASEDLRQAAERTVVVSVELAR